MEFCVIKALFNLRGKTFTEDFAQRGKKFFRSLNTWLCNRVAHLLWAGPYVFRNTGEQLNQ